MEIRINDLEHIREAARQFIDAMGDQQVYAFYGHMGGRQDHLHQGHL